MLAKSAKPAKPAKSAKPTTDDIVEKALIRIFLSATKLALCGQMKCKEKYEAIQIMPKFTEEIKSVKQQMKSGAITMNEFKKKIEQIENNIYKMSLEMMNSVAQKNYRKCTKNICSAEYKEFFNIIKESMIDICKDTKDPEICNIISMLTEMSHNNNIDKIHEACDKLFVIMRAKLEFMKS